jgi:hypothetical protein
MPIIEWLTGYATKKGNAVSDCTGLAAGKESEHCSDTRHAQRSAPDRKLRAQRVKLTVADMQEIATSMSKFVVWRSHGRSS